VAIVFLYFALAEKILRSNRTEADEAKRMLGGFSAFWRGKLAHNPSEIGDYRATRGLTVDRKKRKITLQSTLSSEKFRAIFNR
jgi:hypothetical protein